VITIFSIFLRKKRTLFKGVGVKKNTPPIPKNRYRECERGS